MKYVESLEGKTSRYAATSEIASDESMMELSDVELDEEMQEHLEINMETVTEETWPQHAGQPFYPNEATIPATSTIMIEPSVDSNDDDTFIENFPGAAEVKSEGRNLFAEILDNDEFREKRLESGVYYPFSGAVEWELAE